MTILMLTAHVMIQEFVSNWIQHCL